ncbi:MAG: lamin tail domain-containing protein [Planctomycetota bacterium]
MLASAFLLCAMQGIVNPPVVINEFSYDDTLTDDREFVELYNRSKAPVNISGWVLDSEDPFGKNKVYTIPSNTTLAPGAFWVLGSAKVPNVNQVVGTINLWENSQESLTLLDTSTPPKIIDTLIYEVVKGIWTTIPPRKLLEGEGVWGTFFSVDGHETSWSRLQDGMDTNNNRDFHLLPSTPGKTNNPYLPLPYSENFDKLTSGGPVPKWGESFVKPKVIDPTKISVANPHVIKASPQGGLAAVQWDPAGGGNTAMLLHKGFKDVLLEAWVYFDAKLENTGESETWSIGVQGGTGTFFNIPDPSGKLGTTFNANTGVSWIYQVTDTAATLYLVDHNDGGWGTRAVTKPVVLGSVLVKPGVNDGWQRLRLQVVGNLAEGRFGGSYGFGDGVRIAGTISAPAHGGVYIGYRENVAQVPPTLRPFTFDRLQIGPSPSQISLYGTATKSTVGTPIIGTNGVPVLGWAQFRVTGSGLVKNNISLVILGTKKVNVPLVGGVPGLTLLANPEFVFAQLSDATGKASYNVPLPPDPRFSSTTVYWQIMDIDNNLTTTLKFANSQGMATTLF